MKLVLRVLPTVFVLISSTAFADTTVSDLPFRVGIGAYNGINFNLDVQLFGLDPASLQFVEIEALGHTPPGWFGPQQFSSGESVLGPTTTSWDFPASLTIGSNFYQHGQFDVFPTAIDVPFITLPANGKDFQVFSVTFPRFVWELDGTVSTNCPSSGCNFEFQSGTGDLSFGFTYLDGAWHPSGASFTAPEPGTLTLLVMGIGAIGWRKFSSDSLARGRTVVPV